jgi:hypothetical protein
VKFVDAILTFPAWNMDNPPPRLYVLDEEAAQLVEALEFAKALAIRPTAREGARANTAPPAALLAPEAHDPDEVAEFDCINEQL